MQNTRIIFAAALTLLAFPSADAFAASPVPINPNLPVTEDTYYVTRLMCPKHPSDAMQFWMGSKAGWTANVTLKYASDRPKTVTMEVNERNKGPVTVLDAAVDDAALSKEDRELTGNMIAQTTGFRRDVCLADAAARARHDAMLAANRAHLGVGLPQ